MAIYNEELVQSESELTQEEGDRKNVHFEDCIEVTENEENASINGQSCMNTKRMHCFSPRNDQYGAYSREELVQEVDIDIYAETSLCREDCNQNLTSVKLQEPKETPHINSKTSLSDMMGILSKYPTYREINSALSEKILPDDNSQNFSTEKISNGYDKEKSFFACSLEEITKLDKFTDQNLKDTSGNNCLEQNPVTNSYFFTEGNTTMLEYFKQRQGNTATDLKNSVPNKLYTGPRKHILDLPDLVLEHILSYICLGDLSLRVRPVCRTFYALSCRILRLAFKNIRVHLNNTLLELDKEHPSKWNPICAEVLTCKLLESEMDTLRAACSRQVESGQYYFIHGNVLQEYHNIIQTIRDGKINGLLDGFSDTLIKLNEKALDYWDTRYNDEDMPLSEMKLLGVEIVEVLLSALNASGCVVITYQSSSTADFNNDGKHEDDVSGSCIMAGCITIHHCTELKAPSIEHTSTMARRRTLLRYIRSLVRANNCDIVLHKLRTYNSGKQVGTTVPIPAFEHRTWNMCHSKMLPQNLMQESYKKESITNHINVNQSNASNDCNMHLSCSFEMVCPKRMNPFGIELNALHQSPLPSEVLINKQKEINGSNLADKLSADHYIFNMDLKTWISGKNDKQYIEIKNFLTQTNNWFLKITTKSTPAESALQ